MDLLQSVTISPGHLPPASPSLVLLLLLVKMVRPVGRLLTLPPPRWERDRGQPRALKRLHLGLQGDLVGGLHGEALPRRVEGLLLLMLQLRRLLLVIFLGVVVVISSTVAAGFVTVFILFFLVWYGVGHLKSTQALSSLKALMPNQTWPNSNLLLLAEQRRNLKSSGIFVKLVIATLYIDAKRTLFKVFVPARGGKLIIMHFKSSVQEEVYYLMPPVFYISWPNIS